MEVNFVIDTLLGSREGIVESDPGTEHVCRVHLIFNRGGLFPCRSVAPFPPAETMNSLAENPLMGLAVHVQQAAVLHDVLFRVPVPATTSISTHDDLLF